MQARHEFTPHTSELALRVVAPSALDVFAEACIALGRLFVSEAGNGGPAGTRTLELSSVDANALLVDLLNELVYLAETERWAPSAAQVEQWDEGRLTIQLEGTMLERAPARIKSATHHGLQLVATDEGVEAEVIFDV